MAEAGKMLLHWSPRSPYVRKVLVAAHECGLAERIEITRTLVGGTIVHRALMAQNPLGKIPTLVLPDGTVLYDSYVILEYFDSISAGARLFPADGAARLAALRRHALGNGMLDFLLAWVGERWRPEERRSAPHMDMWAAKLQACLEALEAEAPALSAAPYGVGHLAIGIALGYLDFRFASENWRAARPRLAAWHETFAARPAVQAVPVVDDL
jgi:glutathione S-transferase